MSNLTLTVPS